MNVFFEPRDGSAPAVRLTDAKDRDLADYFWKGNSTVVYRRDFSGDENFQLFSVNIDTQKATALTPFAGVRSEVVDDLEGIDESHVLFGMNKRNPEIFDVFRLDVTTGKMALAAKNPGNIQDWITDHHGKIRAAVTSDGVNHTLLVRDTEKGKFRKLLTTDFKESVAPQFFTFDNKNLYALSNRGRDKLTAVVLDLKTGKEKEIFANPDVDLQSLSFSKKRHVLWTAVFETWKIERHFFDAELATIFSEIQTKLPGFEIDLANTNRDETIFILHAGNDRSRGAYYVYDSKSHDLKKLADLSPWIDASKTSEMKPVEYTSRDGLIIHGYLTLPHGKEMTNLPVVVNPHGGPWARDSWGFNPEVQFLASRGYAVLQMNYRGSTGYGQKFWESSFKQWGRAMQDDISDGVKWLISQKIADPKRVAIYGGSYGGYATLAGVTFTPELYACAIDYVGVSNLFTFMKTVPAYWKPFMEEMHEMVGDPEKDKDLMASASPVFHVDRIRAPLFVAQGAKDPRVNIAESNQIVEALKKRGIVVQYMVKENEGHGFHNEENRFDFYRAMEKFLGKYL
jgi:dipeptidyl aminopeptidase/acylaminoacyl peptidase